jgi:hypothetical protein
VYIGTAEERAAKNHADDDGERPHYNLDILAPGFTENVPRLC